MIYFDTAFIAKCYLNEPDSPHVRTVARDATGLACCELGRIEFFAIVHRQYREAKASVDELHTILAEFEQDERNGVWLWLPLSPDLIRQACDAVRTLPQNSFLRASDALHLECARQHGFRDIHTNDRHLLACAPHFGLQGVNPIP